MARPIKVVEASADVRAELERRAKAATSAHRDRFRADIILLRLGGPGYRDGGRTDEDIDADGVDMVEPLRAIRT